MGLSLIENRERVKTDAPPFDYKSVERAALPPSLPPPKTPISPEILIKVLQPDVSALSGPKVSEKMASPEQHIHFSELKVSNRQLSAYRLATQQPTESKAPEYKTTPSIPSSPGQTEDEAKRSMLNTLRVIAENSKDPAPCLLNMNNSLEEIKTACDQAKKRLFNVSSPGNLKSALSIMFLMISKVGTLSGLDFNGYAEFQMSYMTQYSVLFEGLGIDLSIAGDTSMSPLMKVAIFMIWNTLVFAIYKNSGAGDLMKHVSLDMPSTSRAPDQPRFSFIQRESISKSS